MEALKPWTAVSLWLRWNSPEAEGDTKTEGDPKCKCGGQDDDMDEYLDVHD